MRCDRGLSELIADTVSGMDIAADAEFATGGVETAGTVCAAVTRLKVAIAAKHRKKREATRMYFQREVIRSVYLGCGLESYLMG